MDYTFGASQEFYTAISDKVLVSVIKKNLELYARNTNISISHSGLEVLETVLIPNYLSSWRNGTMIDLSVIFLAYALIEKVGKVELSSLVKSFESFVEDLCNNKNSLAPINYRSILITAAEQIMRDLEKNKTQHES